MKMTVQLEGKVSSHAHGRSAKTILQRMIRPASVALMLAGASVVTTVLGSRPADAETMAYLDRAAWEAAVGQTFVTEDFNTVPVGGLGIGTFQVGLVSVEYVNHTNGGIDDGADTFNADGTLYLRLHADGDPVRSSSIIFPAPVIAWAIDFSQLEIADSFELTFGTDVAGEVLATLVGAESGFIGFVSDTPFTAILFADSHPSFATGGIDNLSFVTDAIFVDGFESGGFDGWTVVPEAP
jgi:hypothetical protein